MIVNRRRHALVATALVVTALTAACSTPSSKTATGPSSTATPATTTTTTTSSTSPASPIQFPPKGILTASVGDGPYEIGVIDPDTGAYKLIESFARAETVAQTLTLGSVGFSETVFEEGDSLFAISPDGRHLGATKNINGQNHAGWIDTNGTFTDVNAGQQIDPFDGTSSFGYAPEGFDASGKFYYRRNAGANQLETIFVVPAGQTTGATQIGTKDATAVKNKLTVSRNTGAITTTREAECSSAPLSRIDDARAVTVTGFNKQQISIVNLADCHAVDLLPATNLGSPKWPVANPGATMVAFTMSITGPTGQDETDLFKVPTDGTQRPVKIDTHGTSLDKKQLIGWY